MNLRHRTALTALALACAPVAASGAELFSDNFDAGTSASRYDEFKFGLGGVPDAGATYNFNYGAYTHFFTDLGGNVNASSFIPQAPRSPDPNGPRIGLRLDANNDPAQASPNGAVINLYPKLAQYSALPSGDHKMTFDVWMNYTGPETGNIGSMEFFSAGINTAGGGITGIHPTATIPAPATPAESQNIPGYSVAVNGERTNGLDYRFYRNNTRLGSLDLSTGYVPQDGGVGFPGPADGDHQFYQDLFPFENPDPNIDEVWYETTGGIGKHWTTVEVKVEDEIFYLYMKPAGATQYTLIGARTDRALTSGGIMLGYADIVNGTAAIEGRNPDPNQQDANFGIFDNVVVESIENPHLQRWTAAGGGNWSSGGNWLNGDVANNNLPAFIHDAAVFAGSAAPQTITVDAPHSVRSIAFDGANSYTIAGTNTITIDGITSGIRGTFRGVSGSHTISAPLHLNKDTDAIISAGARVNLAGDTTANTGLGITKLGAGTLEMKNVRLDRLAVNAGTVEVTANGGATGTSVLKTLAIATGAKLQLNNNDLIVDYGTTSVEGQVRQWVKDGRTATPSGILVTPGNPDDDVVLAVADNAAWGKTVFNGINIDSSTVVGKYTYFGDANLDGKVTGDDYLNVDANLGTGDSWLEGDFNMSGVTTGDDYLAIDANLGKGTADPLAFAELKEEMVALHAAMFGEEYLVKLAQVEADGFGSTVVPEPAAVSLIALGALGLLGRRRRKA